MRSDPNVTIARLTAALAEARAEAAAWKGHVEAITKAADLAPLKSVLYGFKCLSLGQGIEDVRGRNETGEECPLCDHVVAIRDTIALSPPACEACNGAGEVFRSPYDGADRGDAVPRRCSECHGTGHKPGEERDAALARLVEEAK